MTATDTATDVVADVAEEVADQSQQIADAARGVTGRGVGFAVGAFLVGVGVGGGLTYVLSKRRLETKFSKIADDEITEMREHYRAKATALEAEAAKRPVDEIVRERGYSSPDAETIAPPMAVQPPTAVRESEDEAAGEPSDKEPEVRNIFQEAEIEHEWDYHTERRRRSPDIPYVIHYDERHEIEGYSEVTLTYYGGDDVLCNERDEIVDLEERDKLVGEKNLERFGHGSNDASIVYIRNDALEIMYEVVKSPNSYSEEVHGFRHTYDRGNLERMRARERDEQED